jgi:alcohol dehydrogenase (NADP+)
VRPHSCLPLRQSSLTPAPSPPRSTRTDKKKDDILKMGADHVIATGEEGWLEREKLAYELDMVISTVDVATGLALNDLLSSLNVGGKLVSVGLPDDKIDGVHPFAFIKNGCSFGSSHIGSKKEVRLADRPPCASEGMLTTLSLLVCLQATAMLKLAAEKNIKPWSEPLSRMLPSK